MFTGFTCEICLENHSETATDNDFCYVSDYKISHSGVIDHLATILKGKRGQVLNCIRLGNLTTKHFQGYEVLK